MWELRWVLLGLGVLVVAGIYFWPRLSDSLKLRRESAAQPESAHDDQQAPPAAPEDIPVEAPEPKPQPSAPKKVVTVRFVPKTGEELNAELAVLALRKAGLQHGRYGIFHYPLEDDDQESEFSVASLIEPGSFDLTNLKETSLPGMSFFMVLPGLGDPVSRFDRMVAVARNLLQSFNAELFDEQGSSWSIQRERYVREEIIEYCHQQQTRA